MGFFKASLSGLFFFTFGGILKLMELSIDWRILNLPNLPRKVEGTRTYLASNIRPMQKTYRGEARAASYLGHIRNSLQKPIEGLLAGSGHIWSLIEYLCKNL
jgi:hypothetical protein